MSLPHSNIEYAVNKDGSRGYCWNFETGCANSSDICAVRNTPAGCWAEKLAGRFHRDFTPQFHEDIFNLSFPRKPGARILVCFTGDISYARVDKRYYAARAMEAHPEHTFILLTKRPEKAYGIAMPWPSNAWLGVSLTGAETPERQQQVMDELRAIEGQHKRWLSFEPVLGPLWKVSPYLDKIDWIVIGCQTGKRPLAPTSYWIPPRWLDGGAAIPIWFKNNCPATWFGKTRPQELPQ